MDYLKTLCWCSDSIWGGIYDCQVIVSLNSYEDHNKEDWNNVLTQEEYFSQRRYGEAKELYIGKDYYTEDFINSIATTTINVPKPAVVGWLYDNVGFDTNGKPLFAYGSKEYAANNGFGSYSFFFQKRKDAMNFIKEWSQYKKPVHYCQYFTDIRKKLNLETMKYETQ